MFGLWCILWVEFGQLHVAYFWMRTGFYYRALWMFGRRLPHSDKQEGRWSNDIPRWSIHCISSCKVSSYVVVTSELSVIPPVHRWKDRLLQLLWFSAGRFVWEGNQPLSRSTTMFIIYLFIIKIVHSGTQEKEELKHGMTD